MCLYSYVSVDTLAPGILIIYCITLRYAVLAEISCEFKSFVVVWLTDTPRKGKGFPWQFVKTSIRTLAFGMMGRQSCQLCAPAALYPHGYRLVLISFRG